METKRFHLGDVLSVTTGVLMSPTLIRGVYKILNHMTGDNLFTHQLPRATRECQPHLKAQFPALANEKCDGVNEHNHKQRLAELVAKYGEWFDVTPVPEHAHEFIDPMSELAEKVHPSKIITVRPPAD